MNHKIKFYLRKDGITEKYPDKEELESLEKWAIEEIWEWNEFLKAVRNKLKNVRDY